MQITLSASPQAPNHLTVGFFLPKPTPRGALTHPRHPEPSCLTSALQTQPPASPHFADYPPFPPWQGWEQVLGVQELQGQVLGAAAPSSVPLSALKRFWLQSGNEDLHKAKPARCPLCGSRACVWLGLKREGKEEARQFVGEETLRKHWESLQFGRDQRGGTAKARAAAGMVQGSATWDNSRLCSPGGVGCVPPGWASVWESGQSRWLEGTGMGWQDPGAPGRADVSVPNTSSWRAVGPTKDCW